MVARLLEILSSFWPSLALLCLSAIPAAYMHAKDHGKLRWFSKGIESFFGLEQHNRKYKRKLIMGDGVTSWPLVPAPDNWYYRFFQVKYKEAFLFSCTLLSMLTDGYHSSQALMRILMSLSITLAIGAPWWAVISIWWTYAGVHAAFYKLLSR